MRTTTRYASLLVLCAVLSACGGGSDSGERSTDAAVDASTTSLADLPGMAERGTLRVLLERARETYLPRRGAALYAERDVAARFAARHGLDAEFVFVDEFAELLPALQEGRGDLVAANLTITDERREAVAFTRPLDYSRDTLVVASGRPVPGADEVLRGTLAAREGTTLLATARDLASGNEDLEVIVVAGDVSNDSLLERLAAGEFDYALQDGNALEIMLGYRDDVVAGPAVTEPRALGWAVRRDNPELRASLNAFLAEYRLLGSADNRYVADLPELKERRRLRMITRNNAASYFLWRGELLGFEYELARRFADSEGLRLEVVVAPSHDAMTQMLLAGEGDFIAAYLVPTPARKAAGLAFTRPYHYASEVVVGRAGEPELAAPADLAGRRIAVRRSSSYWQHLERLQQESGVDFTLEAAPSDLETQEIIAAVADGEFDLTVADSHILAIEMTWRDDIAGLLNLGDELPHAWAVNPANAGLLAAMNAWLAEAYRGLHYNISYAKYFDNPRYVGDEAAELVAPGRISPWDELVREHAAEYGFDWRLIVAQMHQESRFDPEARSWMGAVGLMQVLPRTAAEFGFSELTDPETGIRAGIRYLAWVRERFPGRLNPGEQTWFALAGYNAGHGHVRDARRLARELGHDPDRWFNNVELAMLKLAEPEYAKRARHGYVRGEEPVQYVRKIRERYRAYAQLLSQ